MLWNQQFSFPQNSQATRVAIAEGFIVVALGQRLYCLSPDTGAVLANVWLWFDVSALIARESHVIAIGVGGIATFAAGRFLWGVNEVKKAPTESRATWCVVDVAGNALWEVPGFDANVVSSYLGAAFGDVAVQGDDR